MKKTLVICVISIGMLVACSQPQVSGGIRVAPLNAELNVQVPVTNGVRFQATNDRGTSIDVTWDVVEGNARGTIDQAGNFTAPNSIPSPPTATIRATTKATPPQSGTFIVTIIPQGQVGISGSIVIPGNLLQATERQARATTQESTALQSATLQADWSASRVQGEILVIPARDVRAQTLANGTSLRTAKVQIENEILRVTVPQGVEDEVFARQLAAETGSLVQPNYVYRSNALPNDTNFGQQSNLIQIDAPGAWSLQTAVNDNLIAVIDTGLVKTLPEIQGRFTEGRDFCPSFNEKGACQGEDGDVTDLPVGEGGNGHGTFIAGQIAAVTGNGNGIAGVTQSGKILIIKVFSADAKGAGADSSSLSKGIDYAIDRGARVLNLSLGVCIQDSGKLDTPDQVVTKAIQRARDRGAIIVAAAGNNGDGLDKPLGCGNRDVQFPANNANVIAVASVNSNNSRSSFSAIGPQVFISAPGSSILSLNQLGTLETKDGTSFAAPQVSAVIGLMLSKNTSLQSNNGATLDTVKQTLKQTAKPLGDASEFGAGLLQAGAAIRAATPGNAAKEISVYLYADPLENGAYNGNSQNAGRAVIKVAIPNQGNAASSFNIVTTRTLQPLATGTYRVAACINLNNDGVACNKGDLGGAISNVVYNGQKLTIPSPIELVIRQTD
jgi:subtilisin family serine protease